MSARLDTTAVGTSDIAGLPNTTGTTITAGLPNNTTGTTNTTGLPDNTTGTTNTTGLPDTAGRRR